MCQFEVEVSGNSTKVSKLNLQMELDNMVDRGFEYIPFLT